MQPQPETFPWPPRVVLEDPDLPHQIVLHFTGGNSHLIAVSCNCLRKRGAGGEPLGVRSRWEASEAIAVWRAHMAEIGEAA